MKPSADIHCHPTLHPFAFYNAGRKRKNSLWWENKPKDRQRNDSFPEYFQTSMPALARGNVRLIIASLSPLEQEWFDPAILGTGLVTDLLAKNLLIHIPVRYINKVQSSEYNYFNYLQKEYEFLLKDNNEVHKVKKLPGKWQYKILRRGEKMKLAINDVEIIFVVPSIEGIYALTPGNARDINTGRISLKNYLDGVQAIKQWEHPPLFISIGHHFYNGLCGHARSIPDRAPSFLLKQQTGLGDPINSKGEEVIDCLLGINNYENNGPRILVDTKHMSIASRMLYHKKIADYNKDKGDGQKIPIITSHAGYNGFSTMTESIIVPDNEPTKYEDSDRFNPWSINLSDQEIVEICQSSGLIGIILDQRILSGMDVIEESKDFTNQEIKNKSEKMMKFWTIQVAYNILGMAGAVVRSNSIPENEKTKIWDVLTIGTDFDGMINPIDSCIVSDELGDLRNRLETILPQMDNYNDYAMNLSVTEILDKVMYNNAKDFVIKHYR